MDVRLRHGAANLASVQGGRSAPGSGCCRVARGPWSVVREREKAIGWISEGSRAARMPTRHARLAASARARMRRGGQHVTADGRGRTSPRATTRRGCRACMRGTLATAETGPGRTSRAGQAGKAAGGVWGDGTDEACLETPRPRPVAAGWLAPSAVRISPDVGRPGALPLPRFNCRWW